MTFDAHNQPDACPVARRGGFIRADDPRAQLAVPVWQLKESADGANARAREAEERADQAETRAVTAEQEKAEIEQKLEAERQLSRTDTKMGIPNFLAYEEYCQAVLDFYAHKVKEEATVGKRLHYAVFLFDIDKFKQINDMLDHIGADEVLAELGKRLLGAFRWDALDDKKTELRGETANEFRNFLLNREIKIPHYDGVFRFGGEEIAIVAPLVYDIGPSGEFPDGPVIEADAAKVARRVESAFDKPFVVEISKDAAETLKRHYINNPEAYYNNASLTESGGKYFITLPVTASIGYVTSSVTEFSQKKTLDQADKLSKYVKHVGRNNTMTAIRDPETQKAAAKFRREPGT